MPQELIEKKFNEMMRRMISIQPVDDNLQKQLRIAFNEGLITGQSYMIEKLRPYMDSLKEDLSNL